MSWTREFHLFFNTDLEPNNILLRDKTGQAPASRVEWVSADSFPVHLWLRKPSNTNGVSATAITIAPTDKIILTGKAGGLGTLLFEATDWALIGEGDDVRYVALLDLNTAPLLAAFAGNVVSLLVTGEIEVQNEDNTRRISGQFQINIRKQIYAGEGSPAPGAPLYPLPSALALKLVVLEEAGVARTLALADNDKYIRTTNAAAVAITVPPQADAAWPDNASVMIEQGAAGQVTIAPGAGVTISSAAGLKTRTAHSVMVLVRTGADAWTLFGDISL